MRFTVGGRPLDLAAEQVSRAMKQVEPEAIREHLVEMNGTVYPPKQVLAVVTGWARTTFTTMEAERVLMRLGFVCWRAGEFEGRAVWVPVREDSGEPHDLGAEVRVLKAALVTAQTAIAGLAERVAALEARA